MEYAELAAGLAAGGRFVLDGAIGTELNRRGASLDLWAGLANVERPDLVLAVHEDYLAVGADVISANTFGCSEPRLAAFGAGERMEELNRAAVALAREARDRAGRSALIAGCVTTVGFRDSPRSVGATPEEEWALVDQCAALADAGADFIIVEMLSSAAHANVQLAAAATAGLPVWAGFSCVENGGGLRLMGEPKEPFEESLPRIGLEGVDVALVMHTTLSLVASALAALRSVWAGPVGAYPHGGEWGRPGWEFDPSFTPELLASAAAGWLADDCRIVGGCCGSTPAHIAALRRVVDAGKGD